MTSRFPPLFSPEVAGKEGVEGGKEIRRTTMTFRKTFFRTLNCAAQCCDKLANILHRSSVHAVVTFRLFRSLPLCDLICSCYCFRPDIAVLVDWALKPVIYLSSYWFLYLCFR